MQSRIIRKMIKVIEKNYIKYIIQVNITNVELSILNILILSKEILICYFFRIHEELLLL